MDNETGKPPKSSEQIRQRLAALHKTAAVEKHSGPMKGGLSKDHKIAIATFYSRHLATKLQRLLGEHGIFSDDEYRKRRVTIKVDYEDSEKAAQLVHDFRLLNTDPVPTSENRRFDAAIFGALISGAIAACFLDRQIDFVSGSVFMSICISIGVLSGHLIDCLRAADYPSPRRIGAWELMVFVSLVALLILFFQLVPKMAGFEHF